MSRSEGRVTYFPGPGNKLVKRTYKPSCNVRIGILRLPCQGVKDHEEDHWAYSPSGSLETSPRGRLPSERSPRVSDGVTGFSSTPPGSLRYRSPEESYPLLALNFYEEEVVEDKETLDRIREGRLEAGEGIFGPVGPEEKVP
jgi:hypothetical protein